MRTERQVTLQAIDAVAAMELGEALSDPETRRALYGGKQGVTTQDAAALWSGTADAGDRWAVVCQDSGKLVGAVGVENDDVRIFVVRNLREMGYGQSIIACLIRHVETESAPVRLTARTARDNLAARALFEAAGFRETGLVMEARGARAVVTFLYDPD